ncbi:PAS domain S-box-containing protein [Malonomonas rubra DSM 5091]|uniref:histidine kinase n=1 Tax=Malonomonas rubra DSM 5091 TaxID=1122189 RepID=A0A1M6B6L8_MALRU|nr:ATP-binding protein [Malonomonas rubra]SHI44123.1 PAS domain S-box-containing protein [Malonomonas rubra DSM 5091]
MNAKWKVILLVMLIIVSICTFFIYLLIKDSRENLEQFVAREIASIRAVVQTIEQNSSRNYRSRVKSFIDYKKFPQREPIIAAFSRQDREILLKTSRPFYQILKKENPYFSTLGWATPDNQVLLRVHRPHEFGDNIVKMRPDIAAANKTRKQVYGYRVARIGLQYRVVQPVSYQGEHIGVVQFGLDNNLLLDAIYEKLNIPVGIVIPNKKFAFVDEASDDYLVGPNHTIRSAQLELFRESFSHIDWRLDQQEFVSGGKTYIIANAVDLLNFEQQPEAKVFVALDISAALEKLQSHIIFILSVSAGLLLLSFILLYTSYGALVQKIVMLNESLEENNRELERRVSERTTKLVESEQRLNQILDHAPLGILIADNESRSFQFANPAICKMLGYSRQELESVGVEALHPDDKIDFAIESFTAQARGEKWLTTDIPFKRKDEEVVLADVFSEPVTINGRDCVVGFIVDQSERKELEQKLNRAQKMEAVGTMASGVAHDLNNILAGIINYPELLLRKVPEESGLRQSLEAIRDSGQRAAAVVADLLTVARGVASVREAHDVHGLIREYFDSPECDKIKGSHPEIRCVQALDAKNSVVDCAPMQLKKALMNLTLNAAEAAGEDGQVSIVTANETIEDSEQGLAPGEYLVLSVIDNGTGIAQADLERIFEPFYTKKEMGRSGSGLGLTVVWNMVQDHRGKVQVESSESGSCFKIYLPLSTDQIIAEKTDENVEYLVGNGERILVVDDESHMRDIACQMLSELGYKAESVSSGEKALEFLKTHKVDLIVIDMLMAPGMNGRETYEEIIKLYPAQKAVIASGYSESAEVKDAMRLGAGAFIGKPYSIFQLGKAVKQILEN